MPIRPASRLVLALFVALMGVTWRRHTDVGDAQLYQVVARNIVRGGDWLHLTYLGQPFYDHLPFGLWPIAIAQALGGPSLTLALHALFGLITVWTVGRIARRLQGPWAGLGAMFFLATSQNYFFQVSYPTLDPLLLLLTTLGVAPLLAPRPGPKDWLLALLFTALAVAVKGPFGLLPACGVLGALAVVQPEARRVARGALLLVLAVLPVAAFLALHPEWLDGYGRRQLLASAVGGRSDGGVGALLAVKFLAGRFWPWLPLLGVSLAVATGRLCVHAPTASTDARASHLRDTRVLAIAVGLVVVGLSLPHRKLWHHTLVAYPLLAVLLGVSLGPWLERVFSVPARGRRLVAGLLALGVATVGFALAGGDRLYMAPPCVLATEFADELASVRPGDPVLVVSAGPEWDMLSALAFEYDAAVTRAAHFDLGAGAEFAVVSESAATALPPGWRETRRARGWLLARRVR